MRVNGRLPPYANLTDMAVLLFFRVLIGKHGLTLEGYDSTPELWSRFI